MCSISVPLVTLPLPLPANKDPNSVRFFVIISAATWVTAASVVVVTGGVGDGDVMLDIVVEDGDISATISVVVEIVLLSDIVVVTSHFIITVLISQESSLLSLFTPGH